MNHYTTLLLAAAVALGSVRSAALSNEEISKLQRSLTEVPLPELPGRAAREVLKAGAAQRDEVAVVVIKTIASKRPGALAATVATISAAAPSSAAAAAGAAAKENPPDAALVARIAAQAAPAFAADIAERTDRVGLLGNGNGRGNGNGNNGNGNGNGNFDPNGPKNPPPAHGVIENRPGTIRGKRPLIPPGLVRDPKPGRDPDRDDYGRPR